MDLTLTLSFLGAAVLLTLAPGPDILFVIAQSISQGSRAGIVTSLGLCTGLLVHITAAVIGISAVVYSSATAFAAVKYAGAAYLIYLAWRAFRDMGGVRFGDQPQAAYRALYRRGILMNVLNPKVSLFFLALLPQFVDRDAGQVPLQMLLLGLIFLAQALIIFGAVSLFAHRLGSWLKKRSETISRRINIVQGLIFLLIALQLALGRRS